MQEKYFSISELNDYIKGMFDANTFLRRVYLKGEISNFKNHSRGHLYFTLKDETSRISAVMFYGNTHSLTFKPEDGMNVLVSGRISCYPAQGSYQIYVDSMEVDGLGNLYIEYEKLKKKLDMEGLFSPLHKKQIPKYPSKIGVITAPTGAAIKDILSTIKRRYPICEVILFPSLVQGASAAPDIVKQLKIADTYNLDTIIVGRGGGSIEDLWAFNDEGVARCIYNLKTPVISAVGHEIDFTIADFVADLRAPTPTGAAEMAVPTRLDIMNLLNEKKIRASRSIKNRLEISKRSIDNISNSYVLKNPMSLYELKEQKLDNLIDTLNKSILNTIEINKNKFKLIENKEILLNPLKIYDNIINNFNNNILKLNNSIKSILDKKKYDSDIMINTLKLVNPLNILEKGYSITLKDDNVIKSSNDLKINDNIEIKFKSGSVISTVKEIRK